MWTQAETDLMVVNAEGQVNEALGNFLAVYFADRLPTPEEMAELLNIPVERVRLALVKEE